MHVPDRLLLALVIPLSCATPPDLGQRGDSTFTSPVAGPATFAEGSGPRVGIDEAHCNFHTANGRYRAFAELLEQDGYDVGRVETRFTATTLAHLRVLVISNALSPENENDWTLPNHSAFAADEVAAVKNWVERGGRLLLIADHMPMPGAAAELARAFGVIFHDGFAFRADGSGQMVFSCADSSLAEHAVTCSAGDVPFVRTFTGQAFELEPGAEGAPLFVLAEDAYLLMPEEAWVFDDATPNIAAGGMLQGALLTRGRGRVAVFGEAAAFSAQLSGARERPLGMNHPDAPHNARFMLNVMHWLSAP